jgi:uncharacterized membrane protein
MESSIIVLGFDSASAAEGMLETFSNMQERGLITLEDAVVASRGSGKGIEVKQTRSLAGKYALGGGGVGLLAGLLLGGPIGGLIGGATVAAVVGALRDHGIDDKFIHDTTRILGPNTSALFLMGKAEDPDRVLEELKPFKAIVASTSLSEEKELRLKQALREEGDD